MSAQPQCTKADRLDAGKAVKRWAWIVETAEEYRNALLRLQHRVEEVDGRPAVIDIRKEYDEADRQWQQLSGVVGRIEKTALPDHNIQGYCEMCRVPFPFSEYQDENRRNHSYDRFVQKALEATEAFIMSSVITIDIYQKASAETSKSTFGKAAGAGERMDEGKRTAARKKQPEKWPFRQSQIITSTQVVKNLGVPRTTIQTWEAESKGGFKKRLMRLKERSNQNEIQYHAGDVKPYWLKWHGYKSK